MDSDAQLLLEFDAYADPRTGAPNAGDAEAGPSGDVAVLTQRWIAERAAPELLPFETELLARLGDRIRQQIAQLEVHTGNLEPAANLRLVLVQTELERVKFLVRTYLRVRLHKIDSFAQHTLAEPAMRVRLAPAEAAYATSHLALLDSHYQAAFLRSFPAPLRRLDDTAAGLSMVAVPDLDTAVFCRVVREPGPRAVVRIPGTGAEFVLRRGDVYVVRYSAVRSFVASGVVELI